MATDLESVVRRLRRWFAVLASVVVLLVVSQVVCGSLLFVKLLMPTAIGSQVFSKTAPANCIYARQIIVVDDKGNERIVLAHYPFSDQGSSLMILGDGTDDGSAQLVEVQLSHNATFSGLAVPGTGRTTRQFYAKTSQVP